MEVSTLKADAARARIAGRSPLLRLQSDERLVALTRKGNHAAFEALVARYQTRLAGFCRHMLGSREDAEDVLQEVFAAAFNAIGADDRPILVRPWLYRIARNRSLNHLRRQRAIGVDTMDVHYADQGQTTADKAHQREEFRQLIEDVEGLAETQRTALLLREMEHLSYEQIALAMDTTIPAVKSLLVRARMGLAEAAESRLLTCDEVRLELGEASEGLKRLSSPVRRHVKDCERCAAFRDHLRDTNKTLAAVFPVGGLLIFKNAILGWFGHGTGAGAGAGAGAAGAGAGAAGAAGGVAATTAGTGMASSAASAGLGALATKAAAGLAAAAVVTAGAVEARHDGQPVHHQAAVAAASPVAAPQPVRHVAAPRLVAHHARLVTVQPARVKTAVDAPKPADPGAKTSATPAPAPAAAPAAPAAPKPVVPAVPVPTQSVSDTATLPTTVTTTSGESGQPAPSDSSSAQPSGQPSSPPPSSSSPPPSSGSPQPTSPVAPVTVAPVVGGSPGTPAP